MSRNCVAGALVGCVVLMAVTASAGQAQHHHGGKAFDVGVHAVGVVKRVDPAELGRTLTEGYLTQPAVMLMANALDEHLAFQGTLDLEGWTLKRGELNHGVWGEGYVDRRHPHTYSHEAIVTFNASASGPNASLSGGKGFVPFGTDDPMIRPFISYPANHHLSQILERLVLIGAIRGGPLGIEGAIYNGDEPTGPTHNGTLDRVGDSWAARATLRPLDGIELQGSYAKITSPEQPRGGGLDQHKRSVSARIDLPVRSHRIYALTEYARTADGHDDFEAFVFRTFLGELSVKAHGASVSVRYENTTRPEEERSFSQFRSIRPSTDNSILGTTRWHIWTAAVAKDFDTRFVRASPFVEVARARAKSLDAFPVYQPEDLYGSDRVWSLSLGLRVNAGMTHERMGRYGAAVH